MSVFQKGFRLDRKTREIMHQPLMGTSQVKFYGIFQSSKRGVIQGDRLSLILFNIVVQR